MTRFIKEFVSLLALAAILTLAVIAMSRSGRPVSKLHAPAPDDDVSALFNNTCSKCHGKDGHPSMRGPHEHAPNFTDSKWQESVSDERLINSITNGRDKMPAFGKKLSDAQITALESYVRKFSGAAPK